MYDAAAARLFAHPTLNYLPDGSLNPNRKASANRNRLPLPNADAILRSPVASRGQTPAIAALPPPPPPPPVLPPDFAASLLAIVDAVDVAAAPQGLGEIEIEPLPPIPQGSATAAVAPFPPIQDVRIDPVAALQSYAACRYVELDLDEKERQEQAAAAAGHGGCSHAGALKTLALVGGHWLDVGLG